MAFDDGRVDGLERGRLPVRLVVLVDQDGPDALVEIVALADPGDDAELGLHGLLEVQGARRAAPARRRGSCSSATLRACRRPSWPRIQSPLRQPRRGARRIAATLSAEKQASITVPLGLEGRGAGIGREPGQSRVDRLAGDQSLAQGRDARRSPTAWVARPSITASARFTRSPVSARYMPVSPGRRGSA